MDSSGSLILNWNQSGTGNERFYIYEPRSTGVAGSATTYTAFDLTIGDGMVPPKDNIHVLFYIQFIPQAPTNACVISRDGQHGHSYIGITNPVTQVFASSNYDCVCGQNDSGNSQAFYLVQGGASRTEIHVMGFYDSLDASVF